MLLTLASWLSKESRHTLTVSSYGVLIKKGSRSRLTMESPGTWSGISFANSKLFFTVNIFLVIGSKRGIRNLVRLYVGVSVLGAEILRLQGRQ